MPPPRLVIVGAVHIAQSLAPMAAMLEFDVTVVDPRGAWATTQRFPDVKVIQDWADEAFQAMGLDVSTAVVTLTHDPKLDDPALESALKSDVFYIGALGSRRTHAKRKERLAEVGITEEMFAASTGRSASTSAPSRRPRSRCRSSARSSKCARAASTPCPRRRSLRREIRRDTVDEAAGAILAHSRRADGINFAKGRVLSDEDIARLKEAGVSTVVAARLDADDMHEDEAAATVARALAGEGIEVTAAFTGRCNHFARDAGLAVLDQDRIDALNELHESVTVATLPPFARVEPRQMVATVKIIPYGAPRAAVARAVDVAKAANLPMISVAPFQAMRAGLVQTRNCPVRATRCSTRR